MRYRSRKFQVGRYMGCDVMVVLLKRFMLNEEGAAVGGWGIRDSAIGHAHEIMKR